MSEDELLRRLAASKTQFEYDNLVDKYLFDINKKNRNTKNNRKHNMLTANQMQQIGRKEKPYDFSKPWI